MKAKITMTNGTSFDINVNAINYPDTQSGYDEFIKNIITAGWYKDGNYAFNTSNISTIVKID